MKKLLLGILVFLGASHCFGEITGTMTRPGGTTGNVQYNQGGTFAGDSTLLYSSATRTLSVSTVSVGTIRFSDNTVMTSTNSTSVPGSVSGTIQFNRNGAFAGDPNLTYSTTTQAISVATVSVSSRLRFNDGTFFTSTAAISNASGANGYIQLYNNGNLGSDSNFYYSTTTRTIYVSTAVLNRIVFADNTVLTSTNGLSGIIVLSTETSGANSFVWNSSTFTTPRHEAIIDYNQSTFNGKVTVKTSTGAQAYGTDGPQGIPFSIFIPTGSIGRGPCAGAMTDCSPQIAVYQSTASSHEVNPMSMVFYDNPYGDPYYSEVGGIEAGRFGTPDDPYALEYTYQPYVKLFTEDYSFIPGDDGAGWGTLTKPTMILRSTGTIIYGVSFNVVSATTSIEATLDFILDSKRAAFNSSTNTFSGLIRAQNITANDISNNILTSTTIYAGSVTSADFVQTEAGSYSEPAVRSAEGDTGIFYPSPGGKIAFTTSGLESARIQYNALLVNTTTQNGSNNLTVGGTSFLGTNASAGIFTATNTASTSTFAGAISVSTVANISKITFLNGLVQLSTPNIANLSPTFVTYLNNLGDVPSDWYRLNQFFMALDAAKLSTSVVDGCFLRTTQNLSSGTNLKTINGSSATITGSPVIGPNGVVTNGSSQYIYWGVSNTTASSVAVTFKGVPLTQTSSSVIWSYQNDKGIGTGAASDTGGYDLQFNGAATGYVFTGQDATVAVTSAVTDPTSSSASTIHAQNPYEQIDIITNDNAASPTLTGYVDGKLALNDSSGNVKTTSNRNAFWIGARKYNAGGGGISGYIAGTHTNWFLFNKVLNATEAKALSDAMRWLNPAKNNVVFVGDSTSAWLSSKSTDSWTYQYSTMKKNADARIYNVAVNGQDTAFFNTNYDDFIKRYRPGVNGVDEAYAYVWLGINDINGGASDSTTYTRLKSLWSSLKRDGFRVYANTLMPGTNYTGSKETYRVALTTQIVSDTSLYDNLYRPDLLFKDPTDSTLYLDGFHLQTLGNTVMANAVSLDQTWTDIYGGGVFVSTITIATLTSKSVPYIDSNKRIAQENADFYYDPAVNKLHVTGTDGADPSFSPIDGMGMYNVGSGMLGFSTSSGFKMGLDSSGRLGIGTSAPTHSITLPSTATGIASYNTADQTTNYERAVSGWSSNEYMISTGKGGSGSTRGLRLTAGGAGGLAEVLVGFGGANSIYFNTNGFSRMYISNSTTAGTVVYFPLTGDATFTAGGTTGNQTINKPEGSVNFAVGTSSITVTNNMVTTNSVIQCTIMTNDATAQLKNVVPASGSFVINLTTTTTAETKAGFFLH